MFEKKIEHRAGILVIGGGIAGLTAAIQARNTGADVIVADKGTIGWAGQAAMAGSFVWFVGPDEDPDDFVQYAAAKGDGLCDQLFARDVAIKSYPVISKLTEWGAAFDRNEKGLPKQFHYSAFAPVISGTTFPPVAIMRSLANIARDKGVRFLDKTPLVEPLIDDGRVTGAAGFDLVSAAPVAIHADVTVLASGSCDYRAERLFRTSCGEGIRFAWIAGARLRNAEFGNLYNPKFKTMNGTLRGLQLRQIRNARGERIHDLYHYPGEGEELGIFLAGMAREISEGRGPCTLDFADTPEDDDVQRPKGDHPSNPERLITKMLERDQASLTSRHEMTIGFVGKLSPVRVDQNYRTSVPGLFAIGDVSHMGSSFEGAIPGGEIPGPSITYAAVSGFEAGIAAAQEARPSASNSDPSTAFNRITEPLSHKNGVPPGELIAAVQRIMCPAESNLIRSGTRLEAMRVNLAALHDQAANLQALDGHSLAICHEAQSILLCAELTTTAALLRTESRGSHLREDFPERDNDHWLKWIDLYRNGDEIEHKFETVGRFPFIPADRRSPWGRYHEPRTNTVVVNTAIANAPSIAAVDMGSLKLRNMEDQTIPLERQFGDGMDVVLYKLAAVKLPSFVPRAVVKRSLRKNEGNIPFLIAWDEAERASLPFADDTLPHILVFNRSGTLSMHITENVSDELLKTIDAQVHSGK